VTDREVFLRAFHAANPGITSRAYARSGIYERFAARVPQTGRVLDLGCGDGHLTRLLGPRAIGVDISVEAGPSVRARAQQLPFADGSFDAIACHLALMLFDEVERVIGELHRVLKPGGTFHALLGGGPVAEASATTDAFYLFAVLLAQRGTAGISFGDKRASSESGWHGLFKRGWRDITFERWELDLSGSFEDVWTFLGSSYQLRADNAESIGLELRARFPGERVPCRVSTYVASVTRR